jgi:hypothetical protein
MDTALKAKLEKAIDKVLNDASEDDAWKHYIHQGLVRQMTNAAELVFDAGQDAQEFLNKQIMTLAGGRG